MADQPRIKLNDGNAIPQLGLGVWRASPQEAARSVRHAIEAGYRHVDTAALYENEEGVGEGLRAAGVPREDVFITTKVWNDAQGETKTMRAFETSLSRLRLDYVDLYLIHWPSPARGLYLETWRALIRLKDEGRVRSIGVSNFQQDQIERLVGETGIVPVLNQIELHPRFQQRALRAYHAQAGLATECWSPLGQGTLLADSVVKAIAGKHGRTPAQIIIRWHLDNGLVAIPKSITPSRITENFDVFSFSLDEDDLQQLAQLDAADGRIGPDPATADF